MLTITEYKKLWDDNFAKLTTEAMPSYDEYFDRENMLEDYLDIFRGKNTRKERSSKEGSDWYYDHPFFNVDGSPKLEKKTCIRYIMIAEAAASPKVSIPINGCRILGGDKNNTYFYNILHLKNTPYLNAPMIAFGSPDYKPCPENKINTLLDLASKGVLLIDLYPFPLPTILIRGLNSSGLRSKINIAHFHTLLINNLNRLGGLYCTHIDFALVAPPRTSSNLIAFAPSLLVCGLLYPINQETNVGFDNFRDWSGTKTTSLRSTTLSIAINYHLIIPAYSQAVPVTIISNGVIIYKNLARVHKYRKVAVVQQGRTFQPHPITLAYAFNL